MYTLKPFKITDKNTIEEFITNNPFAILTSEHHGKIEVTHLPINRFENGKLYGHLAKANIHANIEASKEVCFIFHGPHAYISPTYYASTSNVVPTWNYSAVHIYGNVKYIDDKEQVWKLLEETTMIYEGKEGWVLPETEILKDLTTLITFIEINVTNVEAKFKFNQNRSDEDIEQVIQSLKENSRLDVADFMKDITSRQDHKEDE